MECRKCPYYESKKEITNTGKVVVGFCKLRSKHMSDLTIKSEFCKDRATIDIPQGTRTIKVEPEKKLFTPEERQKIEQSKSRNPITLQALTEKKASERAMNRLESQQGQFLKPVAALQAAKPASPAPAQEKPRKGDRVDEDLLRRAVWGGGR